MAEGGDINSSCSICLEVFKTPKLLPCYHTFCAVCLEKYIDRTSQNKKFECPLCRKSIDVPSEGVASLQTNFYINPTELSVREDYIPCDVCGPEQKADHRCIECEDNFCTTCTKCHMTMKLVRQHTLIELKTTNVEVKRKLKARAFCRRHPSQEILVVCKKCDQLLCVLCTITGHKDHDTREIAEEAVNIKKKLASEVDRDYLNKGLDAVQLKIQEIRDINVGLNQDLTDEIKEVQKQCWKLKDAVDAGGKEMEAKLTDVYKLRIKKNTETMKELESVYQSRTAVKQMAMAVMEKETDVGIVEKGTDLLAKMTEYEDRVFGEASSHFVRGKHFHADQENQNVIKKIIGVVEEISTSFLQQVSIGSTRDRIVIPIKDKLRLISSFKLPIAGHIYSISTISNDRAWVYYYQGTSTCRLYLVGVSGHVLQDLKASKACLSVATDRNEDCIVSCNRYKSIMRVTTGGKEETLLSGLTGTPRHAVIRSKTSGKGSTDELLFCTGSELYSAPYTTGARPAVLSSSYVNLQRVATDPVTGNICMSDYAQKKVFVFDKDGNEAGTYKDDGGIFQPYGICFDHQGCILATNESQNHVRRLKADGSLVEVLFENECQSCRAVVVDKNKIWLGGSNGQIRVYELC